MPQDTPSRHLDQYVVRFPDGLRDRLKAEAKRNNRSLNAEIIARLESSLDGTTDFQRLFDQGEAIKALLQQIDRSSRSHNRG